MSTSVLTAQLGRTALAAMAGGQLSPEIARPNEVMICAGSWCAVGSDFTAFNTTWATGIAYPAANRALAFPFQIAAPFLVRKVWWHNGASLTDSADVAVYTEAGVRLVSGGGTATANASVIQEVDVTDTLIKPGRYWCAYAQNGTTANPLASSLTAPLLRVAGCAQMATAYPLPSTFTPAAIASTGFPVFGISSRTLVV